MRVMIGGDTLNFYPRPRVEGDAVDGIGNLQQAVISTHALA